VDRRARRKSDRPAEAFREAFSPCLSTGIASGYKRVGSRQRGSALGRSYFHLHLVSDSTGETLIAASRAAAAQYQGVASIEHVYPLVRTSEQLERVIAEIENAPGIVLFTLVDSNLSRRLVESCEASGSPCLSVLEPILNLFASYLGQNSTPRAGAQHMLNAEYFKRIDALNYTMMSDDGQLPENLEHADIVLVGVSRTSKTPTSIYLANRGVRTANIPLVPGVPLQPGQVFSSTGLSSKRLPCRILAE
jgi:[pyruvate, water dikinase]-phosphate phosphotransferase / [pyruvate, water dikinase] kinase